MQGEQSQKIIIEQLSQDLEDLEDNISLSEFTLDDFRIELANYIEQNKKKLEEAPFGLYAVVPAPERGQNEVVKEIIKPGVIYCLKQKGDTKGNEEVNTLQAYFLVYIRNDGTVRFNYTHAKQILEIMRMLCQGVNKPYEQLCEIFNDETKQGSDMGKYNVLLQKAIREISEVFGRRAFSKHKTGRDGILIPKEKQASKVDDFELITWLVIN